MSSEKSLTPQIRFKGFTEAWEQRKLGDLLQYEQPQKYIVISSEYDNSFDIPVLTAGQSFILGWTNEKTGIKKASPENPVIIFDDFVTSSHYVDFPFKIKSSAMKLLSSTDSTIDIDFSFNLLKQINYTPISHMRHWISMFAQFNVYAPRTAEQVKIGQTLKKLDNLITLHQRKLDFLKRVKSALLEKMFPKDGSNIPEIRFAKYTEAWEQRKLGDIATKQTSKNTNSTIREPFTNSAEQGVISQYDYFDHGITNVANISNYFVICPNDFVYNPRISVTAPCGPINRNRLNRPGIMSPLYTIFRTNQSIDVTYLEYYFKTKKWHSFMFLEGNTGARSDRFSISDSTFFKLPIQIPSKAEQKLISKQFEALSNLIALHQRKLDALKKIKSALLEKMFV